MKHNKRFVVGMLVMVLALSMAVVGCDNGTIDNTAVTYSLSIAVADGSQAMGSVTITSGSPTGNVQGASVTVTAVPAANYHFEKWVNNSAGMGSVSANASYSFNINANTFLYVVFAPDNGTDGIITPEGTWDTDIGDGIVEATFTDEQTWTFTMNSYSDNGTYTLNGNYGEIYSDTYETTIGMFALTSDTKMTMYLVSPNPITGIFYGMKPGKLTVTGLAAYEGNYIFAHTTSEDMENGKDMVSGGKLLSSTSVEAVKITNGEAVIPLYEVSIDYESHSGEISGGFSGDPTLNMDFVIMNTNAIPETWTNHPANWVANDEASITFTKGIATLDGGNPAVIDWDGDD